MSVQQTGHTLLDQKRILYFIVRMAPVRNPRMVPPDDTPQGLYDAMALRYST